MGYRHFWGKGAIVVSAEWTPWAFGSVARGQGGLRDWSLCSCAGL